MKRCFVVVQVHIQDGLEKRESPKANRKLFAPPLARETLMADIAGLGISENCDAKPGLVSADNWLTMHN